MRLVVKKREITGLDEMRTLLVEHIEGLEPGLTVVDSQLLLGHATVDVVTVDASGRLALITLGSVADEGLLLRAVETYSWSLEYPDAIRRLYPSVDVSPAHPPRMIFVIERMPDAFHRKIKQLGLPDVDCVEFRLLDVDGTPAIYFDVLARLRRGAQATVSEPRPVTPVNGSNGTGHVVPRVEPTAEPVPRPSAPPVVRATSVRLQNIMHHSAPEAVPPREPAQVVSMLRRNAVATGVVRRPIEQPGEPGPGRAPAAGASLVAVAEPADAPFVVPAPTDPPPAPITETIPELELRITEAPVPELLLDTPGPSLPGPSLIEPVVQSAPTSERAPVAEPSLVAQVAAAEETTVATPEPVTRVSFADIAKELLGPSGRPPASAEPLVAPSRSTFADSLVSELQPVARPAAAPAAPVVTPAAPVVTPAAPVVTPAAPVTAPTPEVPAGFEGLKFPNDGVLTRQWMEFLNQMATSK